MNRSALGLAVGAGYVLGRTRKMKLAVAVATMVAGRRIDLSPDALKGAVAHQIGKAPQVKEIGGQLRGVGKAASGAFVERQLTGLADRLHSHTEGVRGRGAGDGDGASDDEAEEPEEDTDTGPAADDTESTGDTGDTDNTDDTEPAARTAKKATRKTRTGPSGTAARKATGKGPAKKPPARKAASGKPAAKPRRTAAPGRGRAGGGTKGGGEDG